RHIKFIVDCKPLLDGPITPRLSLQPRRLAQRLIHACLPARPFSLEAGYHLGIEAQGNRNLRVPGLWAPSHVPAHLLGQGREGLGKRPGLGELCVSGLRRIRIAGDHRLNPGFAERLSGHSSPLSFRLAGRIEITETPSAPRTAKTTAIVPSASRPI